MNKEAFSIGEGRGKRIHKVCDPHIPFVPVARQFGDSKVHAANGNGQRRFADHVVPRNKIVGRNNPTYRSVTDESFHE